MRPTKRTTWILLLSFLGLMGLEGPGCSNEVDNIARNGKDPAAKGECTPAADDGDPCTLEGCEGQANAHVVTAGLPCGLNNDLICTATGDCGGCASADQCGTSTGCLPWVCDVDKICRQTPSPNGQAVQTQIPNDCKKIVCDGMGGEKTTNDDTDVPFYDCYMTTCSGGMEVKTPSPQGTACNTNGGKSCDGQGLCIECNTDNDCVQAGTGTFCDLKSHTCFSCTDGKQSGDESDIDCGGDRCSACTQGKNCNVIQDCATNLFCADGVCCTTACTGPCQACNLVEGPGECNLVPDYGEDPSYGAGMSCLSADGLACKGGNCGKALGSPCTAPADCASGRCGDPDGNGSKTCVKTTGDACTQNVECFSNNCMNGFCLP